jgi:hypothetical protein
VFEVEGGSVTGIGTKGVSCNGSGGCYADNSQFFPGVVLPIGGAEFSGTLDNKYGTVVVSGTFDSPTHSEGTYEFVSESGCCTVKGVWRAEFSAPFAEPVEEPDTVLADVASAEDAGPDSGNGTGDYPPGASPEQKAALDYVNTIREVLDLPLVGQLEAINKAAQAHAEYFVAHCQAYLNYSTSPHEENPNWEEGFSGVNFYDRMAYFGFGGMAGWEVMAFIGDPVGSVDGWMATLYHRIPFVNPFAADLGYGMVTGKGCYQWASGVDVMDFSRLANTTVTEAVVWPYDGQTGVPKSWDGAESPQPPMPKGHNYPSGPIITLTFPGTQFSFESHELLGPSGPVEHQWVTPQNDPVKYLQDTVSLYALAPLAGATVYTVRLTGSYKGKGGVWEWSFTTEP